MQKELLFSITKKDFNLEWFSGSGGGGQHRNKHQNCCRLTHKETRIMKTGQRQRSRIQNLKDALISITESEIFKKWHKIKCSEAINGKTDIEEKVNNMIENEIMYEIKVNDKWVKVDKEYFDDINEERG